MQNLTIFGEEIIDKNQSPKSKKCISNEDLTVLTANAHYGYGRPDQRDL